MPGGFCTVLGILYVAPGHFSSILEYDVNGLRGVNVESGALGHRSDVRHVGQYRNVLGGAITGARYRHISRYDTRKTGQFVRRHRVYFYGTVSAGGSARCRRPESHLEFRVPFPGCAARICRPKNPLLGTSATNVLAPQPLL